MTAPLLVGDVGAVRVLTLLRPEARNALSGELISALYRALREVDADEGVRAAVLTGSYPAFCAGVDLKEAARDGAAYFARFDTENCIGQAALVRKPLVGAVNGAAFTGGLELALGCDFLVASERAVFADTHVRVGVLPGGGMTVRLPARVGPAAARRMSMTGEVVDVARAERLGLVTEVVPHAELLDRAVALASAAAEVPAAAMAGLKAQYAAGERAVLGGAFAAETELAGHWQADPASADHAGLEERRRAVLERNRRQLGG
ncbi:enoyl-CoA hydratase [Trujillonella humicola]|uniref:enoyl-CoA hydratase n=1 Tax=Trujillonella humicola TaxID=3383699 RepID=UPI0039062AB3